MARITLRKLSVIAALLAFAFVSGVAPGTQDVASQEIATGIQEDDFSIRVEPENPRVGEHFEVIAGLVGRGGQSTHSLTLVDVDPDEDGQPNVVLENDERSEWQSSVVGASWQMYAEQPGPVTLGVYVYYEKAFICDELEQPFPDCRDFTSFVGDTREIVVDVLPNLDLRPNADVNDDGAINSLDALWVLQKAAGMLPSPAGVGEAATLADGDLEVVVEPANPAVGEHFEIRLSVDSDDERMDLGLKLTDGDPDGDGEDNVLPEVPEHPWQWARLPQGTAPSHSWRFYAIDEGAVTFSSGANVMKPVACDDPFAPDPGPGCPFVWRVFDASETFAVNVAPAVPRLNGDANGDGRVGSIDAALILQYAAGLISSLGGQ